MWPFLTSPDGINFELMPIMRMTMPRALEGSAIDEVPVGERLGRSWLLLFGVLPVEYDDIMLAEVEPGRRFLETSSMLSMKQWRHERILSPEASGGCRIEDNLAFEMRLPIPGVARLAAGIVSLLFKHRHARLADRFGSQAGGFPKSEPA